MDAPVSTLRNLGPRSDEMLALIGIRSARELRDADPYDVYRRQKGTVPGTSLNALYALIGALEDRHWQEVRRERRAEILLRLEVIGLAPR
jgi:DNA transformation protein